MDTPIYALTAVELCNALSARELSSAEIVAALIERREEVDPGVNAIIHRFDKAALAEAAASDAARTRGEALGPLAGLPITIKENFDTIGLASTLGFRSWQDRVATRDAGVVQAARRQGAIPLGKTNIPMALLSMESHNDLWGTTRNPWDLGRSPGGSSGGEAAAVASGQSPLGIGSDIGGSIRIPAAWCGVCGFKPTYSRWSSLGQGAALNGQEIARATAGPIARSADDLILAMSALSPELQHHIDPRVPPLPLPDPRGVDLSGLRVGFYEDDGFLEASSSIRRAVREAADALSAAGATLVSHRPAGAWELMATWMAGVSADGGQTLRAVLGDQPVIPQLASVMQIAKLPSPVRKLLASVMRSRGEKRVAMLLDAFGDKPVLAYWALAASRSAMQRAELDAWAESGIDALLGPATATPPALLEQTGDWAMGAYHTMRGNILDLPSGVQPVSRVRADEGPRPAPADRVERKAALFETGATGLPVAVQITARPWEEHISLALMSALEQQVR